MKHDMTTGYQQRSFHYICQTDIHVYDSIKYSLPVSENINSTNLKRENLYNKNSTNLKSQNLSLRADTEQLNFLVKRNSVSKQKYAAILNRKAKSGSYLDDRKPNIGTNENS